MTQSCTEAWSGVQATKPPGALIHPPKSRHPQEAECSCHPPAGCLLGLGSGRVLEPHSSLRAVVQADRLLPAPEPKLGHSSKPPAHHFHPSGTGFPSPGAYYIPGYVCPDI